MRVLKNHTAIGILPFILLISLSAFKPAPKPLATVKKGVNGYVYSNINKSLINPKIAKGRLTLVNVNFHHIDDRFYLVRKVKTKKGKFGFLFSVVRHQHDKLFPIEIPEIYWPCWQVVDCQCERPAAREDCRCTTGGSGCVKDWGGPGFENLFQHIYI